MCTSTTDWIIKEYTQNGTENLNLEPAKNFTFIWSLFEKFSKENIFSGTLLINAEFINWVNSLKVEGNANGIIITNQSPQNEIKGELVIKIHESHNYFYQLYKSDESNFVNILYDQTTKQVESEKQQFNDFMSIFSAD